MVKGAACTAVQQPPMCILLILDVGGWGSRWGQLGGAFLRRPLRRSWSSVYPLFARHRV